MRHTFARNGIEGPCTLKRYKAGRQWSSVFTTCISYSYFAAACCSVYSTKELAVVRTVSMSCVNDVGISRMALMQLLIPGRTTLMKDPRPAALRSWEMKTVSISGRSLATESDDANMFWIEACILSTCFVYVSSSSGMCPLWVGGKSAAWSTKHKSRHSLNPNSK